MTGPTSAWVSCHGAAAIKTQGSSFNIVANEGGSVIRPVTANDVKGSVFFLLPSLPGNASSLTEVAVEVSIQNAWVDEVAILSGGDELYRKKWLRQNYDFTLDLTHSDVKLYQDRVNKGIVLSIAIEFQNVNGLVEFRAVGLQATLASVMSVETVRFDSGTWNTEDVRPWNQPRDKTEGRIEFSKPFSSAPRVVVSMTGADVKAEANFRARVYATSIDPHGFTVHADTWGDTEIYSCGVSWVAIGV